MRNLDVSSTQHLPPADKFFDRTDAQDLAKMVVGGNRCILVQAFAGEVSGSRVLLDAPVGRLASNHAPCPACMRQGKFTTACAATDHLQRSKQIVRTFIVRIKGTDTSDIGAPCCLTP